jgi:hypothetical protein
MQLGSHNRLVEGSSRRGAALPKGCLHTLSLCIYSGVYPLINQSNHLSSFHYIPFLLLLIRYQHCLCHETHARPEGFAGNARPRPYASCSRNKGHLYAKVPATNKDAIAVAGVLQNIRRNDLRQQKQFSCLPMRNSIEGFIKQQ